MMMLANCRASSHLSFMLSLDSWDPSRDSQKLDLRIQLAAEVLSVMVRMQNNGVKQPSWKSIQMLIRTAKNSSILMLRRPSHGVGKAQQRQTLPSAE
eukprot:scaffold124038_cov24-Attheya_sp.AAC.4